MNTKHARAQCTCGLSCSKLHTKLRSVAVSSFVSTFVYVASTSVNRVAQKIGL